MQISTREATINDYEGLCELFAEVDTLHREALPHIYRQPDGPARPREFIHGIISDENAALLVAERDHVLVGVIKVQVADTPDIPVYVPRRYAAIDTLVVKKESRRAGVGRALLEAAEQWARNKGAATAELTVMEFNEGAISFYEHFGYKAASRKMRKSLE
jgi:ribosomal protein S18 acetylase RimI-like enzyme